MPRSASIWAVAMVEKMTVPGFSCGIALPANLAGPSLERQIIDFLDGRSDGAELMLAIYGDVADEKLPPRLAELVKHWLGRGAPRRVAGPGRPPYPSPLTRAPRARPPWVCRR